MTRVIKMCRVEEGEDVSVEQEQDGALLLAGAWDEIFLSTDESKSLYLFLKEHYEPQLDND